MRVPSVFSGLLLLFAGSAYAQATQEDWLKSRDKTAQSAATIKQLAKPVTLNESGAGQADTVAGVLTLTSWRSFPDSFGDEVVVGEVQNLTGATLSFSKAIFDFYNGGTYVGSDYNYIWGSNGRLTLTGSYVPVLAPGAVGFFKVWTNLPYPGITNLAFRSEAETYALAPVYGSFAVGAIGLAPDGFGGTDYAGTVRNLTGSFTTFFTQVALAGYSGGLINDVDFTLWMATRSMCAARRARRV